MKKITKPPYIYISRLLLCAALGVACIVPTKLNHVHADDSSQVVWNFDYTGAVQTFTAPRDGTYKLEVWGAQGGVWARI